MGAYGSPDLHPKLRKSDDWLNKLKWKYCEKCGHQFLETESACPKCGYKSKRSGWTRFWATIAILEALFIGFIFYVAFSVSNQPTDSNSNTNQYPLLIQQYVPKESMSDYKTSCKEIDYETLARNPAKYKGERCTITGEVFQVIEISSSANLVLMHVSYVDLGILEMGYWEDIVAATIPYSKGSDRILEDDIITIWGECKGLYTYETMLGSSLSVPSINARYYSLKE